jgi:uncharacterized protein YgbK (DUF1537 family)
MPNPTLAIVADDLSSATDCGVQVARWGLAVTVPLQAPETWPALPPAEVLSVTTESRPLAAAQAAALTRRAAAQLWDLGYRCFFKSMDSTLRGNVLAEVQALWDVAAPDLLLAAPAFPTYGRTTEGGIQKLNGQPIHATEFGSDPLNPVRDSDVADLLMPLGAGLARLGLAEVRQPEGEVAARLLALAGAGCQVVVADASEEADLARLVSAVKHASLRPLWVGSTGLAGHVGGYFRAAPQAMAPDLPERLAPGLVLAGTASEHTRGQFAALEQRADCTVIKVNPRPLAEGEAASRREHDRCVALALRALGQGRAAALGLLSSRDEVAEVTRLGARQQLTPAQVAQRLTQALARLAGDLLAANPDLSGLVLTGGETASAMCAELGVQAIQIIHEVEPGIPLTRLVGPRPARAIIKAGAFGSPQALVKSLQHLGLETDTA